MNQETVVKIEKILCDMMDKIIRRRTIIEPFNELEIATNNPFGYRLVPMEIWKGSKFERSFVTSMGQRAFEQLSKVIAEGTGAISQNGYARDITINTWRKEKVDELLSSQRISHLIPSWDSEIEEILSLQNNRFENIRVLFDLYIKRPDGQEEFYSMKTVKPNLDQTEIAKKTMLYMKSCNENSEVYFALPFNPAGEGNSYRTAHSIPYKIFNMDEDDSVLIGSAFWNKVGANENTYGQLLQIFERVGQNYSRVIRKDYLGLTD